MNPLFWFASLTVVGWGEIFKPKPVRRILQGLGCAWGLAAVIWTAATIPDNGASILVAVGFIGAAITTDLKNIRQNPWLWLAVFGVAEALLLKERLALVVLFALLSWMAATVSEASKKALQGFLKVVFTLLPALACVVFEMPSEMRITLIFISTLLFATGWPVRRAEDSASLEVLQIGIALTLWQTVLPLQNTSFALAWLILAGVVSFGGTTAHVAGCVGLSFISARPELFPYAIAALPLLTQKTWVVRSTLYFLLAALALLAGTIIYSGLVFEGAVAIGALTGLLVGRVFAEPLKLRSEKWVFTLAPVLFSALICGLLIWMNPNPVLNIALAEAPGAFVAGGLLSFVLVTLLAKRFPLLRKTLPAISFEQKVLTPVAACGFRLEANGLPLALKDRLWLGRILEALESDPVGFVLLGALGAAILAGVL
jgi:hypothetical protein